MIAPAGSDAERQVTSMLDLQVHRGPDAGGTQPIDGINACLGTRRLAILDTSELAHQPMVNPDTGDIISYNGEIYNFKDLRRDLEGAGYSFRSNGDTEVLMRGLEQWGVDCLSRLEGMFALAFWQQANKTLLLARDPLGIKPLYVSSGLTDRFAFASETRALTRSGLIPSDIDHGGLAGYLAYGSVPEPATIFKHLKALPPGNWIEVGANCEVVGEGTFWKYPEPSTSYDPQHSTERGRAVLEAAIESHLQSDVPLGVFLSSGLDSAAVVGLSQMLDPGRTRAFTVSFPDDSDFDEATLAAATAAKAKATHEQYPISHQAALSWAEKGLAAMDQPAGDGLNTFMVSRAAKENGLTVALSGLGGDEIFGGYPSFVNVPKLSMTMNRIRRVPDRLKSALAALATAPRDQTATEKARDIATSPPNPVDLYLAFRRNLSNTTMKRLGFDSETLGLSPAYLSSEGTLRHAVIEGDPVATVGRLESSFYLRNTLLRDSDVFGMANSLEIRVPYLHTPLVDWAMAIPGKELLPHGVADKHQLRRMTSEFVVPGVANQPKRGFALPLGRWMEGPLRDLVASSLQTLSAQDVVSAKGLQTVTSRLEKSTESGAHFRLWSLVTLGSWLGTRATAKQGVRL